LSARVVDERGQPAAKARIFPASRYFEVLSYAGTLTLTATVDAGQFHDLSAVTDALRAELDLIIYHPAIRR
jgi:hypothetical protein